MFDPIQPVHPSRSGPRSLRTVRMLHAGIALLAGVALTECGELPTVVGATGQAHLSIVPVFSSAAAGAQLRSGASVNNVRVRITRPPGTVLKDTVITFALGQDSVVVRLVVVVTLNEQLDANLQFRDGETVLFEGHTAVTAYLSTPTGGFPPVVVPVDYVGPGKNAAKVVVSPATGTFGIDADIVFSAQVLDSNNAVVTGVPIGWSVSDATLGTIDAGSGVLHPAGKRGTITVVANTPTGLKGSASILLTPPPKVTIAPRTATLTAFGNSVTLGATVLDGSGNPIPNAPVTWTSRQPAIASVNAGGTALAVANGSALIVATSGTAADSISVIVSQVVDTVIMSRDSVQLAAAGDTATIVATLLDANRNLVTNQSPAFTSSDVSVATVTSAGLVTLKGAGIATITAAGGSKRGNTIVRSAPNGVPFRVGFVSLRLTPPSASVRVGDTLSFSALRLMSDGTTRASIPRWASDAPGRASIDANGQVIAYDTITATITATDSGIAGHANLIVLPAPVVDAFAFAPTTVTGVSTAAQATTVTAALRDAGSGISSMQAVFTAPDGSTTRSCTITSPYSGTFKAGGWRCAVSLPIGSPTGTWHLTSLTVVGTITRAFNETALSAFGTTTLTVNP